MFVYVFLPRQDIAIPIACEMQLAASAIEKLLPTIAKERIIEIISQSRAFTIPSDDNNNIGVGFRLIITELKDEKHLIFIDHSKMRFLPKLRELIKEELISSGEIGIDNPNAFENVTEHLRKPLEIIFSKPIWISRYNGTITTEYINGLTDGLVENARSKMKLI